MPFIPHTEDDIERMLKVIGVDNIENLFDEIPPELISSRLEDVPRRMTEMEVNKHIKKLAQQDGTPLCFAGAGAYEHHIPSAVWHVATRGEFYTAYTPYQPEVSQGTLQVIYEYQSIMAKLTGMQVSNASLYDGASALAEAVLMSVRANRKSKSKTILIPETLNPIYKEVTHNIVKNQGIKIISVALNKSTGLVDHDDLDHYANQDITALVIPQPNYFGLYEDVDTLTNWAKSNNAFAIGVVNPIAMALLTPPGEWGNEGADICIGEGQPLGIPVSSGGPYFGFLTCKQQLVRQVPGRIVGRTTDLDGEDAYALTYQTREQHIRRAKATSNICTNQGLMVTAATVYMSLLGPSGLKKVAVSCVSNTNLLKEKLSKIDNINVIFNTPNFHEFVIQVESNAANIIEKMAEKNIVCGVDISQQYPQLGQCILLCVTETKTEQDIDHLVNNLQQCL